MQHKGELLKTFIGKGGKQKTLKRRKLASVCVVDAATSKIVEANSAFLHMLKYQEEDLHTLSLQDIAVAGPQEVEKNVQQVLRQGKTEINLRQYRCQNGEMLFVEVEAELFIVKGRSYIGIKMRDVTNEQHIRNRLKLAAQVFESAIDGILVTDAEGVIQFANPSFLSLTGYDLSEILGMTPRILKSARHDESFYHEMWQSLNGSGQWKGEIWNKHKNGEIYPEWVIINAIKNELGQVTMYSAIYRDLTERMQYEEKIRYYAYHDGLTDLPNRMSFYEHVKKVIAQAMLLKRKAAILFLDLDGFKEVNDNYGHDVGDLLLRRVAMRLREAIGDSGMVARMGGDEFTIILADIQNVENAKTAAQNLQQQLKEPFQIEENSINISGSIGISLFPEHGNKVDILIKKADQAMYQIKTTGKNGYMVTGTK